MSSSRKNPNSTIKITGTGTNGNDFLQGSAGNDTLLGLGGNDGFSPHEGRDLVDGGAGFDVAHYFYSGFPNTTILTGIKADLNTGIVTGGSGNDTLTNIEGIVGSKYQDTLTGNNFDNLLIGGAGNDSLSGREGNDTLVGIGTNFGNTKNNLGLNTIDTLTGGQGKDLFVLGGSTTIQNITTVKGVYYNDGITTSGTSKVQATVFGLINRTSDTGWRDLGTQPGNRFHFGIDFGSGGVAKDFKAGISGTLMQAGGGDNNTIIVKMNNGNLIEYLHASKVNVTLDNKDVTPTTNLGKTGSTGTNAVHLHIQAKDSEGKYIDTDAALLGQSNIGVSKWPQGVKDYALIQDFEVGQDKIQLAQTTEQYRLLYFAPTQGAVTQKLIPSGTAILWDNDDSSSEFKRAELVGVIAGQNISSLSGNFTFV